MNNDYLQSQEGQKLEERYRILRKELAGLGWITDGSVTPNHPGHWRWTRKVKAKTITMGLSEEQAGIFKAAIADHRRLESILREMRAISQEVLLNSAIGVQRKSSPKNIPNLP